MEYLKIILAIIAVESGGNDLAVGDNGKAYGCLQMHSAYVQDASEYAGRPWEHDDAFDRQASIEIFKAYMGRYATSNRVGKDITAEHIARIHNGGPNGHLNPNTEKYWIKVKAVLKSNGCGNDSASITKTKNNKR